MRGCLMLNVVDSARVDNALYPRSMGLVKVSRCRWAIFPPSF